MSKPIQLKIEDLPTKYLALCEIMSELTGATIEKINEEIDNMILKNDYVVHEVPPQQELH